MKNKFDLIKKYHSYFNLALITKAKTYKLEPTKTKNLTLKINTPKGDFYLHSKYNPEQEAHNLIKSFSATKNDIIIVLGLGLGYHLFELIKTYPDNYILVIEPDNNILRTFFDTVPDFFIENKNIVYLTKDNIPNLWDIISYFIFKMRSNLKAVTSQKGEKIKIKIFKHTPSFNLYPEIYGQIEKMLLDITSNYYSNILTEENFNNLWERNIKKNLKYFKQSIKLKELKNIYKDKPMVIVSAGYSLEKNLEFLKKNYKKMVIVSVDTCLRFLIKNNIYPDYVLSLDAGYANLGDFKFLNFNNKIKLIYDIVSFPAIQKMFNEKYITYTLKMIKDFYNQKWIENYDDLIKPVIDEYGDFGGLQSGGSVSTNALDFALFTGANPIYFIGLDLNYFNYKTHCRGVYKEKYLLNRINKFFNYETLNLVTVITRKNIKKVEGNNVYHYDFILRKYQQWFDNAFQLIQDREIIRL